MSLKYRTSAGTSASNFSDLVVKVGDTLPIGSEIDYDGQSVPAGWQEVEETNLGDVVVDSIRTKNMYNINADTLDMILNSSGGLTQGTGYRTSQFIKVKPSTDYTISKVINTAIVDPSIDSTMRIGYFTSNKTFISRPTSTNNPYSVTTPATCEYVKISYQHTISGQEYCYNVQLEEGSTATTYKPYQELNNQEVYSTGETRIGTWIDGKPIYRKVLKGTTGAVYTTKTIGTIANLGEIVRLDGFLRTSAQTIPGNFAYNNEQVSCYREDNNIIMRTTTSGYTNQNCYVIVEYTKTTD